MFTRIRNYFTSAVTILLAVWLLLTQGFGLPLVEPNSTTLLFRGGTLSSEEINRNDTAIALAEALGEPIMELNTLDVQRYLFADGTSVDQLSEDLSFEPWYETIALKQIVLPLWSLKTPEEVARRIEAKLKERHRHVDVILQPDSAIPKGDCVLIFSAAFQKEPVGNGFAILVRKNALRMGGKIPSKFIGDPNYWKK